ncbi:cyclophilin-like fold protein [Methylophilus sp. Leaf408]|jgi:hypothetical protein|uniref:cyclophilin-like fold protein n=1 Tax=Methylophilus sp. Leaf408 TaxID=2876561 RepID=UPI001E56BFAE|nr:cyclophilin-like fold protein [Methylophilus sp. Leaf408]
MTAMLTLSFNALGQDAVNAKQNLTSGSNAMKILIQIEGHQQQVIAILNKSPATLDLMKQLPLTLELADHAGTEKIAYTPRPLSTPVDADRYEGKAGDITYYAPWGNLAIFYKDSEVGKADGLVFLGKLDSVPEVLSQLKKIKVLITKVK